MEEEQQLPPILISYVKLADWLVDRRRMHREWRKKLAHIHAKITSAFASLPKQGHPWLLSLTPESTGYLEARKIRDVVTAASQDKGVFARLGDPAREWNAIVHAYHKDNVYLGEAALLMVQNVNYDLPFMKKQIAKVQQQLTDLERKEAELKRNTIASASMYQQACQELGIAGMNVRSELLASVSSLPGIFSTLRDVLSRPRVDEALHLYQLYASFGNASKSQVLLAALKDIRDIRDNALELGADPPPQDSNDYTASEKDIQQWDGNDEEIQWDIDPADIAEFQSKSEDNDEAGIMWEFDESQLQEEAGGSVVQDHAMSLASRCPLVDPTYRNNLSNDLYELKGFLVQRVEELDNGATAALQSQIQAVASASLPHYASQALQEMRGDVSQALNLVTSSRTRNLVLMSTSTRFLDRLELSLKEKKHNEAKSLNSLKDVEQRKVELRNVLSSSWPKQEELVFKTQELKRCVEEALSQYYNGRTVNITGEITSVCT